MGLRWARTRTRVSAKAVAVSALVALAKTQLRFFPGVPLARTTEPLTVRLAPGASVPMFQVALPPDTFALDVLRRLPRRSTTEPGGTSRRWTFSAGTGPTLVTVSEKAMRCAARAVGEIVFSTSS